MCFVDLEIDDNKFLLKNDKSTYSNIHYVDPNTKEYDDFYI